MAVEEKRKRGRPKKQLKVTFKCMNCGNGYDKNDFSKINENNHLFNSIGIIPICICNRSIKD